MPSLAVIWTFEIFEEYEFDFQIELLKYDLTVIKKYKNDFDFYMCILPEQKDLFKPYLNNFPCKIHYYDLTPPDWAQIAYEIHDKTRPLIMPAIIPFDLLHKYDMVLNIQADNYIKSLNFEYPENECDLSSTWYAPNDRFRWIGGGCILFYKTYLKQLENVKKKFAGLHNNPRYFFEELLLSELYFENKLSIANPAMTDSVYMNQRTIEIFYKNKIYDLTETASNALYCMIGFLTDLKDNKIIVKWIKTRLLQLSLLKNKCIFKDKKLFNMFVKINKMLNKKI